MKFLVDENLPPSLARALDQVFPGSVFVDKVELAGAPDAHLWAFARDNGFAIITKDTDFQHRSFLYGCPPQVVLVKCGAMAFAEIVSFVAVRTGVIQAFVADNTRALLVLE